MNPEFLNYLSIINEKKKIEFDTLFFEITNRCNFKCIHCYNSSEPQRDNDISLEMFINVVSSFIQHDITKIVVSGGEALLHKRIWDIFKFVKSQNMECTLLSNGSLLTYDILQKLQKFDINLQISLDGACKQSNDIVRGSGTYITILNALELIRNIGFSDKTSVNTVITKYNYKEIPEIIELVNKYGISAIGFSFINDIGRAQNSKVAINEDDLLKTISIINSIARKSDSNVKPINITQRCRFVEEDTLFLTPVVDATGNLYVCEFLRDNIYSIGNLFKQSLPDLLKGDKFKKLMLLINLRKYYISNCIGCSVKHNCFSGCMAQVVDKNIFNPAFCLSNKRMLSSQLKGLSKLDI